MRQNRTTQLDRRKRYLQVALNSTLEDARAIIAELPVSDRILLEADTPFIKQYGMDGVGKIRHWYEQRISGGVLSGVLPEAKNPKLLNVLFGMTGFGSLLDGSSRQQAVPKPPQQRTLNSGPATAIPRAYVVADLKTMDRGSTEVAMAAEAGASAAIALGSAPIETLNAFMDACASTGLDAMIDMMNVDYPLAVLRKLKQVPPVVILHRGVDEERDNREKMLPLHEIRRIKGAYDIMISIAGGDTSREIQRATFNDANIVVIWKSVFHQSKDTLALIEGFLKDVK